MKLLILAFYIFGSLCFLIGSVLAVVAELNQRVK